MNLILSYGLAAHDATPTRIATTWQELVQWLEAMPRTQSGISPELYAHLKQFPSKSPEGQQLAADKSGPYLVLADHGGGRRALETMLGSCGVPLDFDSGLVNYQTIVDTLKGYSFVAFTTYAHSPERPRWRVFVPVARPMTADEHYATWQQLSNAFPGGADPAAKDPSRLSYLPGKCIYPDNAVIFHEDGAFFPPAPVTVTQTAGVQAQHEGPVPGWAGPTDDETLLAVACTARMRPDERLGGPVHFAMLWHANAEWLAQQFPSKDGNQPWDFTQADMALAGELAYFTGSDYDRMVRLMLASGLAAARGQDHDWSDRKVPLAVDRAISNAKRWHFHSEPKPVDAMVVTVPPEVGELTESVQVATAAQAALLNGPPNPGTMPGLNDYWGYMPTASFIHRNTGDLHASSALDQRIGKDLRMAIMASRPVDRMTWAPGRPERFQQHEIDKACDPERPIWLYNKYRGPRPATRQGDVTPWLDLLRSRYPDDADHILNYFADAVQNPESKCNHALVLGSGTHGIGKDTLLHPLSHAVGSWNYRVIKPADLAGTYNPWVASRVLLVNESRDMGDGAHSISRLDMYEKCKELCAAPPDTIEVNDKYINQHPVLNVLRLILTTNHRTDGLHVPPEDRRHYCAWSEAPKLEEDEAQALWDWYAAGGEDYVAHYLATLDLHARGWNRKAPPRKTEWWHQLAETGRTSEDERFNDVLERMGRPEWITLPMLAGAGGLELAGWMAAPGNRRKLERELDKAGYRRLSNPAEPGRGRWYVDGARQVVYRRADVPEVDLLRKFGA